jgi:hypothetical protein
MRVDILQIQENTLRRVPRYFVDAIVDWLLHVALPLAIYALLVLSAVAAPAHAREALFGVGAATLLLLFIGIHNAWDGITYHVLVRWRGTDAERHPTDAGEKDTR